MKRLLSTLGLFILLGGLGVLAFVALSGNAGSVNVVAAAPGAARALEPNAPAATINKNMISTPLKSQQQFTDAGLTYDAKGLASFVGAGVDQVRKLNSNTRTYYTYYPAIQDGDNFQLTLGGVYWLDLTSAAGSIVSFVGDVPAAGELHFTLVRPTSIPCRNNDISLPLDKSSITTPQQLADAIGNVEQVLSWNASTQTFLTWYPDIQDGDNFAVKIGYPYRVCLKPGGVTTWP